VCDKKVTTKTYVLCVKNEPKVESIFEVVLQATSVLCLTLPLVVLSMLRSLLNSISKIFLSFEVVCFTHSLFVLWLFR